MRSLRYEKFEFPESNQQKISPFTKSLYMSNALCDFLDVPHGSVLSRADITRMINSYIKTNNLTKEDNKRIILPDEKLCKLFNIGVGDEINFFKLQTYITPLIIKK